MPMLLTQNTKKGSCWDFTVSAATSSPGIFWVSGISAYSNTKLGLQATLNLNLNLNFVELLGN